MDIEKMYELAVNHYNQLNIKSIKGCYMTEKENAFINYIEKNCYTGFIFSYQKPLDNPELEIKTKMAQMYKALFV